MAEIVRKYGGSFLIFSYVLLFSLVLFFSTGSRITPTGQVILVDNIPRSTFESMIYIIIIFAVILGMLLHLSHVTPASLEK